MRHVRVMLFAVGLSACASKSNQPTSECEPGEFLGCSDSQQSLRCNPEGTGSVTEACGAAGCNESAGRCNECVPASATCEGDAVATCGADGLPASSEACVAGCSDDGGSASCKHIVPVWIPDACDAPFAQATRSLSGQINTTNATECDRVIPQNNADGMTIGPEICVIGARKLGIVNLKVIGTRAIAFVGDDVVVGGTLDLSADHARSGPGVFFASAQFETFFGGGGAGFRQVGASGGGNEFGANARAGGAIRNPITEGVFSGGSRAGEDSGIVASDDPLPGGGGGGAMFIACRGTVNVTGAIDAGGGGGSGGPNNHGGSGGGSGGYLSIQGARVAITGSITASGGGGGAACDNPVNCAAGVDGSGPDGGAGGNSGRIGGRGGSNEQPPTPGANDASGSTGGGGGSVGRVQIYTPVGVQPTVSLQVPFTLEPNLTVETR